MKICRITSAFVPPWAGLGPGPYELSIAQANLGNDVTVITKYVQGCESMDREFAFNIYRIKAKQNLVFSLLAVVKFLSLHIKNRFDLIHSHSESALVLLLLRPLLRLKVPVVSSVHIVRKAQYKTLNKVQIHRKLESYADRKSIRKISTIKLNRKELLYEKLYLNLSNALAAVNDSVAEQIKEEYGITENVNVIFNGVDTTKFSNDLSCPNEIAEIKSLKSHKHLLLFVGVLNGRKGEFDLIEAMQKITISNNDTNLLIIGDGPARQIVIDMIHKLKLDNHVKLITNIENDKLKKYYLASDIFVLPSYSEGLPKALLEAMACGAPVVVSDISAYKGLIEHGINGYMFKVRNVDSLTSTILDVLGKPEERKSIVSNARKLIEEKFTWRSVTQRLDRIYSSLLKTA